MKTTYNNTYPAYKYTHNGVEFLVFKVMTGYYGSVAKWYLNFEDLYYISERDSSQEFNSKRQCVEIAKYYIDKKDK